MPLLVFVVTKKMREGLKMLAGAALRAGCAMAGAKAHSPLNPLLRPG
jgi:hypothetical protein